MKYEVFSRRWWKDAKCTVPGAGRKTHVMFCETEEDARQACQSHNRDKDGNYIRRPYGSAWEYQSV